jgi:hypothetical protein
MAIMGFIIVVAGQVFKDSTVMRVRTQSMTSSMEEVNKIAALIKEDLSQMGAKEFRDLSASTGDDDVFMFIPEVYMSISDPEDSSSFVLEHRTHTNLIKGDSIVFKKIAFNNDNEYVGVRLVSWALAEDSIIRRRCITIESVTGVSDPELELCPSDKTLDNDTVAVRMATGIQAFTLLPSTPGVGGSSASGTSSSSYGDIIKLLNRVDAGCEVNICGALIDGTAISGFVQNNAPSEKNINQVFVGDLDLNVNTFEDCRQYDFKKGETYSVSFITPQNNTLEDSLIRLFQPGVDHASIGFRGVSGTAVNTIEGLQDFMFYVPQTRENRIDTITHHFEFSVQNDAIACVVFTFAFYSPKAAGGIINIREFKVEQKNEAYHFVREGDYGYEDIYATIGDDAGNLKKKEKVKAFELLLEINRRGEIGSTRPKSGFNGYVIPTPNNGIRVRAQGGV